MTRQGTIRTDPSKSYFSEVRQGEYDGTRLLQNLPEYVDTQYSVHTIVALADIVKLASHLFA